jgi:hypothetical protein
MFVWNGAWRLHLCNHGTVCVRFWSSCAWCGSTSAPGVQQLMLGSACALLLCCCAHVHRVSRRYIHLTDAGSSWCWRCPACLVSRPCGHAPPLSGFLRHSCSSWPAMLSCADAVCCVLSLVCTVFLATSFRPGILMHACVRSPGVACCAEVWQAKQLRLHSKQGLR